MGPPEEWVKLPKLRQTRKTGPARISLTMFGERAGQAESEISVVAVPKEAKSSSVPEPMTSSMLPELEAVGDVQLISVNPNRLHPHQKKVGHPESYQSLTPIFYV